MSQSRGLLIYESLARLPLPFIIHTEWKDETDSGSSSLQLRHVPVCDGDEPEALLLQQPGTEVEVKQWPGALLLAVGEQEMDGCRRREVVL